MSTDVVPAAELVEQLYAELEQKVRALRPNDDFVQMEKAYRLAAEAHKGQMRLSGEPYLAHPLHVTLCLRAFYAIDKPAAGPLVLER